MKIAKIILTTLYTLLLAHFVYFNFVTTTNQFMLVPPATGRDCSDNIGGLCVVSCGESRPDEDLSQGIKNRGFPWLWSYNNALCPNVDPPELKSSTFGKAADTCYILLLTGLYGSAMLLVHKRQRH